MILLVKRWGEHPTVRFLALAFALLVGYHGYLYLTGLSRMSDRLRARLAQASPTASSKRAEELRNRHDVLGEAHQQRTIVADDL